MKQNVNRNVKHKKLLFIKDHVLHALHRLQEAELERSRASVHPPFSPHQVPVKTQLFRDHLRGVAPCYVLVGDQDHDGELFGIPGNFHQQQLDFFKLLRVGAVDEKHDAVGQVVKFPPNLAHFWFPAKIENFRFGLLTDFDDFLFVADGGTDVGA